MFSFSGRLQLLLSVISSTLNIWMSTFILPTCCLRAIEQMCNQFLWNGCLTKSSGIKVSWKSTCLPKEERGIGLRNLRAWDSVLVIKLVWSLFSQSGSLLVAWAKENYLLTTNYWDCEPKSTTSWIWKSSSLSSQLPRKCISCHLRDGSKASFWFDSWCPQGPIFCCIGDSGPSQLGVNRNAVVNDVVANDCGKLRDARSREAEKLQILLASIDPPSQGVGPDQFVLSAPASLYSGTFSSKLTWDYLMPREPPKYWFQAVWFKHHNPKHAFHLWVANLNILPPRIRMID